MRDGAVRRYVQFGPLPPKRLSYHIEFEDLFYSTADRYGSRKRAPTPLKHGDTSAERDKQVVGTPVYVDPLSPRRPGAFSNDEKFRAAIPKLHQQYVALPERLPVGELIIRIRAAGTPGRKGRYPRLRVEAGIALGDGCSLDKRLLGEADVHCSSRRSRDLRVSHAIGGRADAGASKGRRDV